MNISNKLQEFQRDSQTLPLQNASSFRKILTFIYKLLGRKVIAKLLISSNKCNGCNRCVNVCPNHAMKIRFKNPRRNRRCKGCLLCVYACPKQAFELPLSSLVGAFLLLFLPYEEWILKLLSFNIPANKMTFAYQTCAFILWCIGYAIAVYVLDKLVFLLSTLPAFKRFGEVPTVKNIRKKLHPALVFPILVPMNRKNENDFISH